MDIFAIAHNNYVYIGFHRVYDRVRSVFYLYRFYRRLRMYVTYYPQCQTHQITRHRSYGALKHIISPVIPYYTVSGDFILGLPKTKDEMNVTLTLTCKFSKRVKIIPGKNTWNAVDWAHAVFT